MIRPARVGDAAAMAAIWNPIIEGSTITFTAEPKTPEGLAARLGEIAAAGHGAFVAGPGDEVLGFALYGAFRAGAGYRFTAEHTVLLAPPARGRGLGRALVGALLADAAAAGIRRMIGAVSGENAAGLAFHRALGFSNTAVLPGVGWKFGRPLDLHLMARSCGG